MQSALRAVAVAVCSILALGAFALGQSATTSIHGVVTDSKGAVVVNASVTISDPATGLSREVKTGGQGEYQFLELPPATYELTVKAHGFTNLRETGVQLLVRTPGTLNMTLQVAG